VRCLFGGNVLSKEALKRLEAAGLNLAELVKCIESHCRPPDISLR
jgi:hypothetical protein